MIPKIFFILEWRKVWGSVHCGVSNGRNFKSLLQNESLYSSRGEFLSSKGSWKPGASLKYFGVRGTINVSETLLHCIAFIFFFVEKLKKHLSNYPSLYMYSKSRSFTLVPSRGGGLECSVFPGNFILKTYFLKLKGPIKSSSAGAQSSKRIQAEISG